MKIPKDMQAGCEHTSKAGLTMIIVSYADAQHVTVKFKGSGYTLMAQSSNIRRGTIKDVMAPSIFSKGFIGDGKYTPWSGGKRTKQYSHWVEMVRRCYSDKYQEKKPTYKGCTVCDEWLNFQNFAKWFDDNYPSDGVEYFLDKDIKVKGNKVYSPETCLLVTKEENTIEAHAKNYSFIDPKGCVVEVYNLRAFCKNKDLDRRAMCAVHLNEVRQHKGWTKA